MNLPGRRISPPPIRKCLSLCARGQPCGGTERADRAAVWRAKGDDATARRLLDGLVAAEPTLPAPYFSLIELSLNHKDHAETARLLTLADSNGAVRLNPATIERLPDFVDFITSPEYRRWRDASESRTHNANPTNAERR